MPINPYFSSYTDYTEQSLIEDLIEECIQMHGLDMVYLPREFRNLDLIYGEDPVSKFSKSFDLEMYIKNVDGFTGDTEFLSKFGLEIREQATFTVSQRRFHEVVSKEYYEGKRVRPNEGDLIWLPVSGGLFQIQFVEPKSVFYQLGKLYVYDLKVEVYEWSHKELDTLIPDIDNIAIDNANTIALNLTIGSGNFVSGETIYQGTSLNTATAKAEVAFFDISNNILLITKRTGDFKINESVVGATSNASWFVGVIDNTNNPKDAVDNTKQLKIESDIDVDFDEDNPFAEEDL
jgi:hypothetical protein